MNVIFNDVNKKEVLSVPKASYIFSLLFIIVFCIITGVMIFTSFMGSEPSLVIYFAVPVCLLPGLFLTYIQMFTNRLDMTLFTNGFTYGTYFKSKEFGWKEISSFEVVRGEKDKEMVVFTFDPNFHDDLKIKKFGTETYDEALPILYGLNPHDLAEKLNNYRNKFVSDH